MPFKSEAQKGWMYANHPGMAKRWQEHTPKGKKLPEHVHHKKGGLLTPFIKKDATVADSLRGLLSNVGRMTAQGAKHVGVPEIGEWTARAHEDVSKASTDPIMKIFGAFKKVFPGSNIGSPEEAQKLVQSSPEFYKAVAEQIKNRERVVGAGVLGAGAVGVGAPVLYNAFTNSDLPQETSLNTGKEGPSDEGTKTSEFIGTPFTDGFLQCCLNARLSGDQVAELLEKGAELKDKVGEECRGFIQRMMA